MVFMEKVAKTRIDATYPKISIMRVPGLWPPKWLPTFGFDLRPGPADISQIAVAERCQLRAHAYAPSPLPYDLTRADERGSNARPPSVIPLLG
jgi:hypothetical protein